MPHKTNRCIPFGLQRFFGFHKPRIFILLLIRFVIIRNLATNQFYPNLANALLFEFLSTF